MKNVDEAVPHVEWDVSKSVDGDYWGTHTHTHTHTLTCMCCAGVRSAVVFYVLTWCGMEKEWIMKCWQRLTML